MKIKHFLFGAIMSLAMTFGVGASFFSLNRANKDEPVSVEAATSKVNLATKNSGWSTTTNPFTLSSGYWTLNITLTAGDEFKVVVNGSDWVGDGDGVNWGGTGGDLSSDGKGNNFKVISTGNYVIKAINGIDTYGDKSYGISFAYGSCTVTLNKNSGTGGTDSVSVTNGSSMPSGKTAPTRGGYIFDGYWDGTGGTGTQYYTSTMTSARNWDKLVNTTLYAKWIDRDESSSYTKIYRFRKPTNNWGGNVYIHIWGSATASNNTEWPGINISNNYSYNEFDQMVYTFATDVTDYQYIIFHNGSGWQTDTITIGNNTAWQLDNGNTPGTMDVVNQTYYFYDYQGLFGGNAKCYAWQSNGLLDNASYPGVSMTAVQYGSGHLYSITLDPAFDKFECGIGSSSNTGEIWINHNRGNCYCLWTENPDWSDDLDWVKAHDWIYNTMHVRDIETTVTSDTGACRGSSGYYQKAKTAYNGYSAAIRTKMSQDERWGIATTRFAAWARANGESASFSGTTLTISKAYPINIFSLNDNNGGNSTIVIVIIASAVCTGGVGGYFLLRKRKEQ